MENDHKIKKYERFFKDPRIGNGVLKPPRSGTACENIRTALRMLDYDNEYGDQYDEELARLVLQFQIDNHHSIHDGYFGPGTRWLLTQKLIAAHGTSIFGRMTDPKFAGEEYIFISYKREDKRRITRVLNQIDELGYDVWYDESIPGAVEWDALIEEKIASCRLLIVFISQTAVESKLVRREVKFADSQNKPILAIKLEEAELKYGLKMLLSQFQIIDASNANFLRDLKRAIEHAGVFKI